MTVPGTLRSRIADIKYLNSVLVYTLRLEATQHASVQDPDSELAKLEKDMQDIAKLLFAKEKEFRSKTKCRSWGEDGYAQRNSPRRQNENNINNFTAGKLECVQSRKVQVTRDWNVPFKKISNFLNKLWWKCTICHGACQIHLKYDCWYWRQCNYHLDLS